MGTQPSTDAILLSGRGLVVVKEWWPSDGDDRMLQDCFAEGGRRMPCSKYKKNDCCC